MKKFKKVLQLKINLVEAKPTIYRTIYFPSTGSFLELHTAIQEAMGWDGYHLFSFNKGREVKISSEYLKKEINFFGEGYPLKTKVNIFLNQINDNINYTYDFGDDWDHKIVVQKVFDEIELDYLPFCIKGKGACPPEDCGGIWQYNDLIEIAKNPESKEYKEFEENYGYEMDFFTETSFDKYDIEDINGSFKNFKDAVQYQKEIIKNMGDYF